MSRLAQDPTPSDVINSGLKQMKQFQPFIDKHNASVIRNVLEQLYPITCSDETFFEMAKVFLNMAYDISENERKQFKIIKYRDTLSIYFDSDDLFEQQPVITFHYGFVFERPRESWHRHFMRGAFWAAGRTTCRAGRAVGVQVVQNKVPVMSAYNGVAAGSPHPKTCLRVERGCKTGEGLHLCPCNHAEQNAIGMAAKLGIRLEGSTMYVTSRPCATCMSLLSIAQPERIIYDDTYDSNGEVEDIARHASIELISIRELEDN